MKTESFGGDVANLTEAEGGKGIVEAIVRASKADNGLLRSCVVPGWEESPIAALRYNGQVIPW